MRSLDKNKQEIYYKTFLSKTRNVDSNGDYTGTDKLAYSEPIKLKANIAGASNDIFTEQFGINVDYDRIILISETNLPIDETSLFIIDNEIYKVIRISKTLNAVKIKVKKND